MPSGVYVRTQQHLESCKKGARKRSLNLVWRQKNKEANQRHAQDPDWICKNRECVQKNTPESEWRKKQRCGIQKRSLNPVWRQKNKEANQRHAQDPDWICKHREGIQRKYNEDVIYKQKMANNARERANSYEWLLKNKEARVGGFWYGNVNYHGERKKYCELWNKDLWRRIDAFQNHQSILSGKTKEDNGGHALSRHHVYWQEKACCVWDEDTQGYYAMINIGTNKNPNMYKYYIDGDPNKFVLLTRSEHAMIAKDKIKWIKIFEELINSKFNGKCYYTKEEYIILQTNKW
jgi:hypothetical protein